MKMIIYCVGCNYNDYKIVNFLINEKREDVLSIVTHNATNVTNFRNIPVLTFDKFKEFLQEKDKKDFKIIIFYNTLTEYNIASSCLQKLELIEFENYIQYNLFNKKLAIYWGNCHAMITAQLLSSNPEFNKIYSFYNTQNLWDCTEKNINYHALKNCELVIYQDIRENNSIGPFASSENMKKYLQEDCQLIKIPNIYGYSKFFYPQTEPNARTAVNTAFYMDNKWWLWYRDKFIDEYIENNPNYSLEALIEHLKNREIDTQYLDEQIRLFWEKISRMDEQCHVKIKDFIIKNFHDKQLFIDIEHPNFILLEEYARQICSILGINCDIFSEKNCALYGHSIPIYPQVKKYFNLKWDDICCKQYKTKESLTGAMIDFDEYVKQYCKIHKYCSEFNNQELKLN